jgi:DNA modification methylase
MTYYTDDMLTLHHGDAFGVAESLRSQSVQTIVTSPPYFGLRDYGTTGQLGQEASLDGYVNALRDLFGELNRVLSDDGVLWLNLGDSYGKHKSLLGVPWAVASALSAWGWTLRADVIWSKPRVMPESVTDRPTRAHEYVFMFTKQPTRYYYDWEAVAEPVAESSVARLSQNVAAQTGTVRANGGQKTNGNLKAAGRTDIRNRRTVWNITPATFSEGHLAVMPDELARICILASTRPGDTVLDPFSGSGTTGMVANQNGRRYVGIDLNNEYLDLSLRTRFAQPTLGIEAAS